MTADEWKVAAEAQQRRADTLEGLVKAAEQRAELATQNAKAMADEVDRLKHGWFTATHQATTCARCIVFKHTPWRAGDGYICAGCMGADIDALRLRAETAERHLMESRRMVELSEEEAVDWRNRADAAEAQAISQKNVKTMLGEQLLAVAHVLGCKEDESVLQAAEAQLKAQAAYNAEVTRLNDYVREMRALTGHTQVSGMEAVRVVVEERDRLKSTDERWASKWQRLTAKLAAVQEEVDNIKKSG